MANRGKVGAGMILAGILVVELTRQSKIRGAGNQ
jgi:hypothetical protein